MSAENPYADGTSPFVLAPLDAGLIGYDSFMNVVILVSVVSIGVSCVFGGSRTLTALAQQGYAPKIFCYIDRSGRPLASVIFNLAFGPLAYIVLASSGPIVFDWLLALSGLSALFTWGSICFVRNSPLTLIPQLTIEQAHIRFRQAWHRQGRSLDDIPFKHIFGVAGSYIGLGLVFISLAAQFFVAIAPPFTTELGTAEDFFKAYLALPVVLLLWAVGYLWKRQGFLKLDQIDLDSGMRDHDWERINAYRAQYAKWPIWRRCFAAIF